MTVNRYANIVIFLMCVLTGCGKEDPVSVPTTDRAISFTAYAPQNPDSRGVQTTGTLQEFTVYSFIADSHESYMNDVHVTKSSQGLWTYSPVSMWPVGHKLNFYSYSPTRDRFQSGALDPSGNGPDIPDFRNDGKVDLLYGVNMGLDAETSQVKINFRHALSRVQFSFRRAPDSDFTIVIGDVTLQSTNTEGSFRFPRSTTNPGDITQNTGTWSDLKNNRDITINEDIFTGIGDTPAAPNSSGYMFAIPQGLNDDTRLQVRCRILKGDRTLWPLNHNEPGYDAATGTAYMYIPVKTDKVPEWIPGMAYNYTVSIQKPSSDEYMEFYITVDEYRDFLDIPHDPFPAQYIHTGAVLPENTNEAKFTSFRLWCVNSDKFLINDATVSRDGSAWNYSPMAAWPETISNFFGIAEAGWISDENRNKYTVDVQPDNSIPFRILNYNVGNVGGLNGSGDLQIAVTPGQGYIDHPVPMYFRHALAQVTIYYSTNHWENVTMRVRGTFFRTNYTVGDFTLPPMSTQHANSLELSNWDAKEPGIIQLSRDKPLQDYDDTGFTPACILGPQVFVIPQKVSVWNRVPNIPDQTATGQFLFLRAKFVRTDDDGNETVIWPTAGNEAGYNAKYGDAYLYFPLTDKDMEWHPGYSYVYDVQAGIPNSTYTADDYRAGKTYTNSNLRIHLRVFSDFNMSNVVDDRWFNP